LSEVRLLEEPWGEALNEPFSPARLLELLRLLVGEEELDEE
jgi:hypothetical protein